MPTKRNWAGEQQEYIPSGSSKGGEYAKGSGQGGAKFDGKPNDDFHKFTDSLTNPSTSIHEIPEEHRDLKPIKSEQDFSKIKDSVQVVGKDGKLYSYNEKFIQDWINGVKEKEKTLETYKVIEDENGNDISDNGGMSKERVAFDEQEIQNEISKQEQSLRAKGTQPKYERKATFVFGLPAAGKSALSEPLKTEMGAFEIDADLMKQHIPEFQKDPQMVSAVHEESSWMSKKMNKQLTEKGANLIIGKVGGEKNWDSINKMIDDLEAAGYEIDVQVAHKDIEKALEANLGRFINRYIDKDNWGKKPPRIVNTNQHFGTQKTYFDTAIKLFNNGRIKGFKFIDVNDGKNPKIIKEQRR